MALVVEGSNGTMLRGPRVDGSPVNTIQLDLQQSLAIFEGYSIRYSELAANEMELFTLQSVGNVDKVRWASLTNMSHVLTKRKNGCTATPKGQLYMNVDESTLCPIEYFGKICSDAFWDTCFERIFGTGMDIHNMLSTPAGRSLFDMMMNKVYTAIGSSLHELVWFGNHPVITKANDNSWFNKASQESVKAWADYVDQQAACTGIMTLCSELKALGIPQFNVTMSVGTEVNAAGEWTGNPVTFFKKLVAAAPTILATELDRMAAGMKPNIVVSKDIFNSYKNYLETTYVNIPEAYYLQVTGMDGTTSTSRNVLMWNGHKIIYNNEFQLFDSMTGTKSQRAILAYPGVFGIGYDIPALTGQYNGLGLVMYQRPEPSAKGLIELMTAFKISPAVLDKDLMVYSEYIATPIIP